MTDDMTDDDVLALVEALRTVKAPKAHIGEVLTVLAEHGFSISRGGDQGGGDLNDHSVSELLEHIKNR